MFFDQKINVLQEMLVMDLSFPIPRIIENIVQLQGSNCGNLFQGSYLYLGLCGLAPQTCDLYKATLSFTLRIQIVGGSQWIFACKIY